MTTFLQRELRLQEIERMDKEKLSNAEQRALIDELKQLIRDAKKDGGIVEQ